MMIISLLMLIPFYIFKDFFEGVSEDSDIIVEGICFLYTATILFFPTDALREIKNSVILR